VDGGVGVARDLAGEPRWLVVADSSVSTPVMISGMYTSSMVGNAPRMSSWNDVKSRTSAKSASTSFRHSSMPA